MTLFGKKIELNQWQKHYLENWVIGAILIFVVGNAIYYNRFWELVGLVVGVPIVGWIAKLLWDFLKAAYWELKREFSD